MTQKNVFVSHLKTRLSDIWTCLEFPLRRGDPTRGPDQIPPCIGLHTRFLRIAGLESILPLNWSPNWTTLILCLPVGMFIAKYVVNLLAGQLAGGSLTETQWIHCLAGDMLAPIIPAHSQYIVQANIIPDALGIITLFATSNWILAKLRRRTDEKDCLLGAHWMHTWYTVLGSRDMSQLTDLQRNNYHSNLSSIKMFKILYAFHVYGLCAAGFAVLIQAVTQIWSTFLDCAIISSLETWQIVTIALSNALYDAWPCCLAANCIIQIIAGFMSELIIVTLRLQQVIRVTQSLRDAYHRDRFVTVESQCQLLNRLDYWEAIRRDFAGNPLRRRCDLSLMLCVMCNMTFLIFISWFYTAVYEESFLLRLMAFMIILMGWSMFALCMVAGAARLHAVANQHGALLYSLVAADATRQLFHLSVKKRIKKTLQQDFTCDVISQTGGANFSVSYGGLYPVTYQTCLVYFIQMIITTLLFHQIYSFGHM